VIRIANAPVSFGAFEVTVGVLPHVPNPLVVLDSIAAAGYSGTELGPPGYLGDVDTLRERLDDRQLALAGGFVPVYFGKETGQLDEVIDLFDAAGGSPKLVLADDGARGEAVDWPRLADGVARAAAGARARGYAPTFHHHMGSRVETPTEIDRLLELTDVGLLLDTGHLLAAGGDPLRGLLDWRERIDHIHLKDVRLDVLRSAGGWEEAWRNDVFCELGAGDADLEGFLSELAGTDYDGWMVVEQDRFPASAEDAAAAAPAQERNRRRLSQLGF
jgi:inosose dehydratase